MEREFVTVNGDKWYVFEGKLDFNEQDIEISDIKGLGKLTHLEVLILNDIEIIDFSEIEGLEKLITLQALYLRDNKIKDIKGLENLVNLEILDLSGNQIEEIKGLNSLTNLKTLKLGRNQIEEIKGLDELIYLEELCLGYNQIEELKGLEYLTKLKQLYLNDNPLRKPDWSIALMNVVNIETNHRYIWNKNARGVVNYCKEKKEGKIPFVTVRGKKYFAYYHETNIQDLWRADIDNFGIYEEFGDNKREDKEEPLILTLDLHNLGITDITEIQGLDSLYDLEWLDLYGNQIKTIKGLEQLTNLKRLSLRENPINEDELHLIKKDAQEVVKYCQEKEKRVAEEHSKYASKLNIPENYYTNFQKQFEISKKEDSINKIMVPEITRDHLLLDKTQKVTIGTKTNIYTFIYKNNIATNPEDFEIEEPQKTNYDRTTEERFFHNINSEIFWKVYDGIFNRNATVLINKNKQKPSLIQSKEHNTAVIIKPWIEDFDLEINPYKALIKQTLEKLETLGIRTSYRTNVYIESKEFPGLDFFEGILRRIFYPDLRWIIFEKNAGEPRLKNEGRILVLPHSLNNDNIICFKLQQFLQNKQWESRAIFQPLDDLVSVKGEKYYILDYKLDISEPDIDIIDLKGLGKLDRFRVLNLSNLGIDDISEIEGLENLTNLHKLDLSKNRIKEIKRLENLSNIKTILPKVYSVKACETPSFLVDFPKILEMTLRSLILRSNHIKEIKGLEQHINLNNLDLSNNQIQEIKGLENLTNLPTLDLSNNQIQEIKELEQLTKLKIINLWGNPIRPEDRPFLKKGAQEIVRYCQEKANKKN